MPNIHNRVFAALPVPVNIRAELQTLARQQLIQPDMHWIPAANYHITLAFLGDLPGHQLETLCAALNAANPLPAVTIRLRAIAPFPDSSGHIIAAAVHKSAALTQLHDTVLEAATATGIHLHREQFLPHITLARLGKSPAHQPAAAIPLAHMEAFEVCAFALYRGVRETLPDHQENYHYQSIASFALDPEEKIPPMPGL